MIPLFILGNPRSGTSLLRLMLTCHQNIIIPPESHFFLWLEQNYGNWNKVKGYNQFLKDLFDSTKFETWGLSKQELKIHLSSSNCQSYSELIQSIYLFYGLKKGKINIKIWGDKNKLWKEKLNIIPNYFPDGKYIHIIRDGRDVACSFIKLYNQKLNIKYSPKLPYTINEISERWNINILSIETFLKKINKENKIVIRFEDLVNNTKSELVKISNFLNVPFDKKMLNYFEINKLKEYEPNPFMKWKTKLNEQPDPKIIGQYKQFLNKNQLTDFEVLNRKLLTKYGY